MTTLSQVSLSDQVSLADLRRRLAALELRVRAAVEERRRRDTEPDDRFRGLYISDDHVDDLLGRPTNGNGHAVVVDTQDWGALHQDHDSRVDTLALEFGLDTTDVRILLIALAPDVDARFERLFAYLQDDVTQRRPSVGLGLELSGSSPWSARDRSRFDAGSALVRGALMEVLDLERPSLSRHLRVADRIASHLLGGSRVDAELEPLLLEVPAVELGAVDELARAIERGVSLIYLRDRVGAATASVAASAIRSTASGALVADLSRLAPEADHGPVVRSLVREARLTGRGIVALSIDEVARRAPQLLRHLADAPVPVIASGRVAWEPVWSEHPPWVIDSPLIHLDERTRIWHGPGPGDDLDGVAEQMAGFRLSPAQIERARRSAHIRAMAAGREIQVADLQSGARAENASGLDRLARRVEPRARWSDLILPSPIQRQLRELGSRARRRDVVLDEWGLGGGATHGRGVTALFAGDPGTGKTMSAEVVASELGLDLYVIDLSSVVDKYIGETEKNLDRIFGEADRINGVLLFDEADALFGQRSEVHDARDRYANVEIAYLLQRMEQFDGLAILTTNLRANIDEAFLRRLDAVVDFPMPENAERLSIWRLHLPSRVPVDADVDLAFMADRFELAGGHIRNICLTAAYFAAERDDAIHMIDIIEATEREYGKLGRLTTATEFGPYLPLIRH